MKLGLRRLWKNRDLDQKAMLIKRRLNGQTILLIQVKCKVGKRDKK